MGLLTGHAEENYHKHKTGRADSLHCKFGEVEEKTTRRILCECEVLSNIRRRTLGSEELQGWEHPQPSREI